MNCSFYSLSFNAQVTATVNEFITTVNEVTTTNAVKEFLDEFNAFTPGNILCVTVLPVFLLIGVTSSVLLLASTVFIIKTSRMALKLKTLEMSQNQQRELLDIICE